ncbi:MAG: carboxypeptidase-like regulatory domain-containing protein, partial [Thermoanaerobaculia bacterium]
MEISAEAAFQGLTLEAEVNGRGFYQLSGVPPGRYDLQASLSGFAPARIGPIDVRKDLEAQVLEPLVLGRPATLEVTLDPPVEPYGKPWKILLTRRPYETGPALETFEGEASQDGTWTRMGLPPGSYEILILGERKARWAADFLEIRAGSAPLHVEIPVLRIRGLVTQGRQPLSTTLWWGKDGRSLRFDSDAEGRFAGVLPGEGTWTVEVRSEDGLLRLPLDPIRVEAREGGRPAEIGI